MRALVLLFVLLAGLWSLGFRVHPGVLKDYFEAYARKDYRRVELHSGKMFVGEYDGESGDSVRLRIGGGQVEFRASEIAKMTQMTTPEIRQASKSGEIPDFTPQPFITHRAEDSWIFASSARFSITPGPEPEKAPWAEQKARQSKRLSDSRMDEVSKNLRLTEENGR